MMQYTIITYAIYLVVSLALAVWVAHVLFQNAIVFLREIFNKDEELTNSVNQLLKIGFYLTSFGLILFLLKEPSAIGNYQELFEVTSFKIGGIVLLLGGMHFLNVYVFFRLRKKAIAFGGDQHPHFGASIDKQLEE